MHQYPQCAYNRTSRPLVVYNENPETVFHPPDIALHCRPGNRTEELRIHSYSTPPVSGLPVWSRALPPVTLSAYPQRYTNDTLDQTTK